jgi:hypothetical protein
VPLDRSTLIRPLCPRIQCPYMHGPEVACPPAGVWLMAWSEHVNGIKRTRAPRR